jgi:hypothetical protein
MLVRDLVELLRDLEGEECLSLSQQNAIKDLVTILAPHSGMELESLFDLLRKAFKPKRRTHATDGSARAAAFNAHQTPDEFVSALRASYEDDAEFARLVAEAKPNRALTLASLKGAFAELFGRTGNFRSKATRDDVLRKILDERNIKIRNDKMGQMLGRKPVAAE